MVTGNWYCREAAGLPVGLATVSCWLVERSGGLDVVSSSGSSRSGKLCGSERGYAGAGTMFSSGCRIDAVGALSVLRWECYLSGGSVRVLPLGW